MMEHVVPKPLPETNLPKLNQVGKPLRRVDALGKAVGATIYAADYTMPNMLHAKVFRSPVPSARITKLDVGKARDLSGVACVMTSEDVHGAKLNTDLPGQTGREAREGSDAPVLASDVVRYVGEPIALVAAETLEIAEQALKLIDFEYEELPGVFDPIEAMKPGAPILFAPNNVVAEYKIRKGDLDAGMAEADVIVENTFTMPFVEHAYLEPDGGVAWVDEQGVINIRVCTQVIEHFRSIARALNVPQNRIRIRGTMVGGGFGSKEDITVEIFLAFLARETGRPVKLVYTREEAFAATAKRHPFTITHRTGVKKNGRITASHIKMVADSGAYPYLTPYVLLYATAMAAGPYKINNLHVDSVAAATNQTFTSAFRGFGGPQAALGYEQQMDEIAKALGLDPLSVRQANYMKTGDTTGTGQEIKSAAWLEETATRALALLGERALSTPTRRVGRGMASTFQSYGRIMWFHDTSRAWVGMEQDGTVVLRCGVPDIGAGQSNSICQIAAEILGVSLEQVTIYATDSAVTPLAGTSTATRQLYMSGNAVSLAANEVRENLISLAASEFGVEPEGVGLAYGYAYVQSDVPLGLSSKLEAVLAGDNCRSIDISEVVKKCASRGLPLSHLAQFNAPFTDGLDPETGQGDIWPDFTFGAQAVEVAVDMETGQIELLKSAACHDVGRAINPAAVHGQICGGSHQGLGYAMMENFELQDGYIKTPSLAEYLIPTDALGVRITELPFTPKRVLEAVGKARTERHQP